MKRLKLVAVALCAAFMCSCAGFNMADLQKTLGSPAMVQLDIQILGGLAKPKVSADVSARIHQVAMQLNQAADLNLDALFAMLPASTGSQNGDALIGAAKAYLTSVVQKYGARNQTSVTYAHAVANGLLANF